MRRRSIPSVLWRVGAGLALFVFVVGVPVVLGHFGSPLPSRVPTWRGLVTDLRMGYVPSAVLAKVALGAAWAFWFFLGYEIVAETASWIHHQAARHSSALGPFQPLLSRLVAIAVLSTPLPSRAMAGAGVPPLRPPVVLAVETAPAPTPAPPGRALESTTLPTYVVQPRDTLWGIAERHLGNPLRWSEIAELNGGRAEGSAQFGDPHWIYPGWTLLLPADATGLAAGPPPSPVPEVPAPTSTPATPPPRAPTMRDPSPVPDKPAVTEGPLAAVGPERARSEGTAGSAWGTPSHAAVVAIGSGLLAVGLREALGRKRKVQQRRRRSGRRIPLPTGTLRDVETALFAGSDTEAAQWVDRTARLLASRLFHAEAVPRVLAMVVTEQLVELVVEGDGQNPPTPFLWGGPGRWQLPRTEEVQALDAEALRYPSALAGLVTIGHADDGIVLLNLEAGGIVSIVGTGDGPRDLAAAMALELATSPWIEAASLHVIGFEGRAGAGLDTLERARRFERLSDDYKEIEQHAAELSTALERAGEHDAAVVRMRDLDMDYAPLLVICGASPTSSDEKMLSCLPEAARLALAVVIAGDLQGAGWRLLLAGDGTVQVDPLGIRVRPQRISAEELSGVGELLLLASSGSDVAPDEPPYDLIADAPSVTVSAKSEDCEASPRGEWPETSSGRTDSEGVPRLSLLGPVRLERVLQRPQPKALELAGWLVLHPQGTDRDGLATVMWPDALPTDGSVRNLTYRLRQSLGKGPDGGWYLPTGGTVRLDAAVECDWAELRTLAGSESPSDWHRGLGLVRGRPFADVDWSWATTEGFCASMEAEIVDLAYRAGETALRGGDLKEARWAAEQGLLASAYVERLYRLLMEVAARTSGPQAVRAVMARLAAALEAEVEPADIVAAETMDLYKRLTDEASPRQRGSGPRGNGHRSTGTNTEQPQSVTDRGP